jgi:ACT domain-containing protein
MRAVITVIGKDKVGIIAGISNTLAVSNVNILDISQTTMQDVFTMIMLVDISNMTISFTKLSEELEKKVRKWDLV